MKKFFTGFLVMIFSLNIFGIPTISAYEYDYTEYNMYYDIYDENYYILYQTEKWEEYIEAMDSFISENISNEAKLEKIKSRLEIVLESEIENKTVEAIVKYMNARVNMALLDIIEYRTIEEENKISPEEEVSETEKKIIEKKIIKIQLSLLEQAEDILDDISDELEDNYFSKIKWDITSSLNANFDDFNLNSEFSIKDYEIITNMFDSKIEWNINSFFQVESNGETEKLEINTFLDYISKDSDLYFMVKDFEVFQSEWVENIQDYLDTLIELWEKNQYIKSWYSNNSEILEYINSYKIIEDSKDALSNALFETYKKDDDKFYIIPTKYSCDLYKATLNKFDPFYWDDCSDSQYQDMIEEIKQMGDFYITIDWNSTTFGFEWKWKYDDNELYKWSITFDDDDLDEIFYWIVPNQEYYPGEWLELTFKNKKSLDLEVLTNGWENKLVLNSLLDNDNNFEYIDFDLVYGDTNVNFDLDNNKFDWNFEATTNYFDYNTYEYVNQNIYSWTIKWNTDSKNSIEDFKMTYQWSNIDDNSQFLNWSLDIDWRKFNFQNDYNSENNISNISIDWELSSKNYISDLDSNIEFKSKTRTYNYDTWEYEYSDEYNQTILSKIKIDDWEIDWETTLESIDEFKLEISHTWKIYSDKFNLDNSFKAISDYLVDFNWEVEWNLNISTDFLNDKNNFSILFDLFSSDKELINFELENKWKVYNNKFEINTPSNYVNYEDIFPVENYNNYYYY